MTPERLAKYRFSVPIEEDGISVVLRREQTQTWLTILRTIGSPGIMGLLAVILSFVLFVTLILWRIEGYGRQESTSTTGRPRTFAKLYQILLTGPGTNTIASTVRGNSLISFVYFVRIVAASVLVSLVSVNVIKRSTEEAASRVNGVQDLAGKTVSVGQGSVSEHWIEGWNAQLGPGEQARRIQIQPLDSLAKGHGRALGRPGRCRHRRQRPGRLLPHQDQPARPLQVAIRNIHRQSQGLILSPQLPSPPPCASTKPSPASKRPAPPTPSCAATCRRSSRGLACAGQRSLRPPRAARDRKAPGRQGAECISLRARDCQGTPDNVSS